MQITILIISILNIILLFSLLGWQGILKEQYKNINNRLNEVAWNQFKDEITDLSAIIDAFNKSKGIAEMNLINKLPEQSDKLKLSDWFDSDEIRVIRQAKKTRYELEKEMYLDGFGTELNLN